MGLSKETILYPMLCKHSQKRSRISLSSSTN